MSNLKKIKILFFFLFFPTALFTSILYPSKIVKADGPEIDISPNPVNFGQSITMEWTCPSGSCQASSTPSYSEWSGNITKAYGSKTIKIDKYMIYPEFKYYAIVDFSLSNDKGGVSRGLLFINKSSVIYLEAFDNSDPTGNHSTSYLRVTKHDATTTGISLQYAYGPGTWQKISSPPNPSWSGTTTNSTNQVKHDLTNINPLSTSTYFGLGQTNLGAGVDVDVIPPVIPPTTPQANISANPSTIKPNGSTTITWTSANVDTCTVSQQPHGESSSTISNDMNGTKKIDNISTTTDFTIECQKGVKSASSTVTVLVSKHPPPPPVTNIVFYANPTDVYSGKSTVLYWDLGSIDPSNCSASSSPSNTDWGNSTILTSSGSTTVSRLTESTDFYITCGLPGGGETSATATVTVSKKQKPSPMEIIDDYFTRDILSTQICNHINNDPGKYQWDCNQDQKQFCQDFPEYILKHLYTYSHKGSPSDIDILEANDGCYNKKVNAKNYLSILTGEILSGSWLGDLIKFFTGKRLKPSKYISNIDYILRKTEVNRCLFDQCCIYSGKNENLNEIMEGTEEPKSPMNLSQIKDEGAFLTKREQENARKLLNYFCCR